MSWEAYGHDEEGNEVHRNAEQGIEAHMVRLSNTTPKALTLSSGEPYPCVVGEEVFAYIAWIQRATMGAFMSLN
jgi:hypothetical protein